MGFPLFLAFLLVSHLLVVHSSGSCPSSIDCGPLGPVKFPFTKTTHPLCGWSTVSCNDEPVPKVMLGAEGRSYPVLSLTNGTLKIHDPVLQNLIEDKDCNLSRYIDTRDISFTISPNLTFFKCHTPSPERLNQTDNHFLGNYTYRYTGSDCDGYTVYYSYPNQQVHQVSENCTVFQLPVVSSVEYRHPFSLLTSDFSIEYHVSEECVECRKGGGQCLRGPQELRCLNKRAGFPGTRLGLILGTVVPTVGIMVILLFCIIIKKLAKGKSTFFWKKKTENYQNIEAFLKNCGSLSPKRYTYSDIKKITNSFRTKLGQGGFGRVFKGKLENGCLVAVKVLKGLKGNGEEFINEVATISRTSHVNIVTLLGFCFEGRHRALIYEFMPNGSLDKFIHDGGSSTYCQLGWEAMYRIAVSIARGLEYLHCGCNTRILHFDIKPHNIILNEDFCPKISDFGLAKLCPQKESIISLLGARGTVGYIAPEVFSRIFGGVSHKSDVYSYGMMVLEMVGARKNISVEVDHTSEIDANRVASSWVDRLRPRRPKKA